MLRFYSASVRAVNSQRAMAECIEAAFAQGGMEDCGVIIIYATLGHKLEQLAAEAKRLVPGAQVLGNSCAGVIGREGVGESMHEVAIMAICGPAQHYHVAGIEDIFGHNSAEKAAQLAQQLRGSGKDIHTIKLLTPGIDIAQDLVLEALVQQFGQEITIFGGSSSDNMRGMINYQYFNDKLHQHCAWAVGICDPTLGSATRATHGFTAYGLPMVVTRAEGNRIYELDGQPAMAHYISRLNLPSTATGGDIIPIGALAERLPDHVAQHYGNSHILRVITKMDAETGALYYPMVAKEGTELWLTHRDEELIFSEQKRAMEQLQQMMQGGSPVAVFQTDCLARGRFMFNKIVKEELIGLIQDGLSVQGEVPAWLGMYGFGEYAKLDHQNTYHNYSTALLALYRQ